MARGYACHCIIYRTEPYIIVQSYEGKLSGEWVRNVAKMLMTESIIDDYGMIFPLEIRKEDLAKKSVTSFEATTGVKIESRSTGEVLRGANDYNIKEGSSRPTLLFIEDVDTTDSVKNVLIIDQTYEKIMGETIGSLDQFRRRIIVIGNTISDDGILPRFKAAHANKKNWRIRWQPLIYPDGRNAWPEVFTEEIVLKLQDEGPVAFGQNYRLEPRRGGDSIIPRSNLKFARAVPSHSHARIIFGIDPAFSEKTNTDSMALAICAHIGDQRYIMKVIEFKGKEKNEEKFCNAIEQLYRSLNCAIIRIEKNNGGSVLASLLRKRNLAIEEIAASKDKETRLLEQEGRFARGEVYFLPGTEDAQEQLIKFPNVKHDDMVDAIVYSLGGGSEYFTGVIE
jgi:predicted phage terminase large subunit-like protein